MLKNIIILGAGFGGLRCALELERALGKIATSSRRGGTPRNDSGGWHMILVDRSAYHLYSPRLYEEILPHGQRSDVKCQVSIRDMLNGTNVEFVQGEVKGIECKGRLVKIAGSNAPQPPLKLRGGAGGVMAIPYDYLVLALGAGTDYFGIPGLEEYACALKSVDDAEGIREKIETFLKDSPSQTQRTVLEPFSVVIGGAGATGVEVAAELAYLFRRVPHGLWSVTLVEALSAVLWMFPKPVGEYAHKRLNVLGVHVMLDTCIKKVDNRNGDIEVILAPRPLKPGETEAALACDFLPEHEKRMQADLLLWAGGVRSNPLLSQCGLPTDRKGRIEVDEHLAVKGLEGVFAIGDNAMLMDPKANQPVPATAQAALIQGKIVAENVVRLIKTGGLASGTPEARPLASYTFPKFPAIVPLANRDGVALVGNRVFRGFPAWLLRQAADLRYYMSILPFVKAVRRCFL